MADRYIVDDASVEELKRMAVRLRTESKDDPSSFGIIVDTVSFRMEQLIAEFRPFEGDEAGDDDTDDDDDSTEEE